MRYDAVVFDLDGTLTPSEEGIIRSASYADTPMPLSCTSRQSLSPSA